MLQKSRTHSHRTKIVWLPLRRLPIHHTVTVEIRIPIDPIALLLFILLRGMVFCSHSLLRKKTRSSKWLYSTTSCSSLYSFLAVSDNPTKIFFSLHSFVVSLTFFLLSVATMGKRRDSRRRTRRDSRNGSRASTLHSDSQNLNRNDPKGWATTVDDGWVLTCIRSHLPYLLVIVSTWVEARVLGQR